MGLGKERWSNLFVTNIEKPRGGQSWEHCIARGRRKTTDLKNVPTRYGSYYRKKIQDGTLRFAMREKALRLMSLDVRHPGGSYKKHSAV